jgi:hypothetical protein
MRGSMASHTVTSLDKMSSLLPSTDVHHVGHTAAKMQCNQHHDGMK